jgi:ABC-type multidrug transport system fused ATPase/permease subunit
LRRPFVNNLRLYQSFFSYVLPYWKEAVGMSLLKWCGVSLELVIPYLTKLALDDGVRSGNPGILFSVSMAGAAVFLLSLLSNVSGGYLQKRIKERVIFGLQSNVFRALSMRELSYFQDTPWAEQVYRMNNDTHLVCDFLTSSLADFAENVFRMAVVLVVLFRMNRQFGFFSLIVILYVPLGYFLGRIKRNRKNFFLASEDVFRYVSEFFSRIYIVKAFAREKLGVQRYLKKSRDVLAVTMAEIKLSASHGFVLETANKLVLGLFVLYGSFAVMRGDMTLGSLTAIMLYIAQLTGVRTVLAGFLQQCSVSVLSFERLQSILGEKVDSAGAGSKREAIFLKGEISFENVCFAFPGREPVFQNLNFKIAPPYPAALVGPSGCGKTTLLNLVLGLYKPVSGRILIDGYGIDELDEFFLREQIGIAAQLPYLWDDTVENNIRYGKPDASDAEVREAAIICKVDEFVSNLPDGYKKTQDFDYRRSDVFDGFSVGKRDL